eukprot:10154179-Ditylum_brightwellii.AAC.1
MPTREIVTLSKFYDSSSDSENGDTSENEDSCASLSSSSSMWQLGVLPGYQGPVKIETKQSKIINFFGKNKAERGREKTAANQKQFKRGGPRQS